MGIRYRLLIPLVGIFIVLGVSIFLLSRETNLTRLQKDLDQQFQVKQVEVQNSISQVSNQALEIASLFSRQPDVIDFYQQIKSANIDDPYDPNVQRVRQELRSFMSPFRAGYSEANKDKKLKIHFHLKNGRSLLRVWRSKQTKSGKDLSDDISGFRKTVVEINQGSHKPIAGIEIGRGGFALRGLAPITSPSGKHLGSVEMLYGFGRVTANVKAAENQDFAVYMNADMLPIARSLQDKSKYPLVGNKYVQVTASNPKLAKKLVTEDILNSGREKLSPVYKEGNYWICSFPIKDYKGAQVGVFTQVLNVSDQLAAFRRSTLILIVILLLGFSVAFFVFRQVVSRLTRRIRDIQNAAHEISTGNLEATIEDESSDELGAMAQTFQVMQESLLKKATIANRIGKGDLSLEVEILSEKDSLGSAMAEMKAQIEAIIAETGLVSKGVANGDLKIRGDIEKFNGAWRDLVSGINDIIEAFVHPLRVTGDTINQIRQGEIPEKITTVSYGEFEVINNNLNQLVDVMSGLQEETNRLVQEGKAGNLKFRGNESKFEGGWFNLIAGINGTLDAVLQPIDEASRVLERMADGDLSIRMQGDYQGDHALIKTHLNQTLEALNELISQTRSAVDQVADGSNQVSQSSQSLSQGATEQASALEEISASMVEIGSQTRLNADNATQANKLATTSRDSARKGNEQMGRMVKAMNDISESSGQVQKIIKAIDEIAFQTNLLALNAAVEAARAGAHGKGFAVVAEEVRNLAQRSAKAAQETTALIEGSVEKTGNGERIAEETAESLSSIVESVTKVTDLVGEIDSASREQAQAIDQVTQSLGQVDQVTQSNTASAEESAATSEELSGQAAQLKVILSRFTLSKGSNTNRLSGMSSGGYQVARRQDEPAEYSPRRGRPSDSGEVNPGDVISLDDSDFDEF